MLIHCISSLTVTSLKSGNQQGLKTKPLNINTSLLDIGILGISRVEDWMNNEKAFDVTVVLKVSLVPPEVLVWRSWQWHLSRASSIVLEEGRHCSVFYPPHPVDNHAGIHTHNSFREDEEYAPSPPWRHLFSSPAQTFPVALWLRDPGISWWTDAVYHIKILAFCP